MPINGKQRARRIAAISQLSRLNKNMPGMYDLIAMGDAVELLTACVHLQGGFLSATRKTVRQRIGVALKNGDLQCDSKQQFVFGHFVTWAWSKKPWEPLLRHLPALNPEANGDVHLSAFTLAGHAYASPSTIDECHKALHEAHARIAQLEQENTHLKK